MEGCSFLWEFLSIPAAKQSSMSFITWQLRWLSVETLHFSLYLGFLGRRITSSRRPSMSECKDHNRAASQEWKSSGVLNSRGEASFRAFMTPWCSCLLRSLHGHSRTEEWKTVIKQVLFKLFSSVYRSVGICRHLNFCPTQDHTDLINGSIVPSPSTAPKQQLYTAIWAGGGNQGSVPVGSAVIALRASCLPGAGLCNTESYQLITWAKYLKFITHFFAHCGAEVFIHVTLLVNDCISDYLSMSTYTSLQFFSLSSFPFYFFYCSKFISTCCLSGDFILLLAQLCPHPSCSSQNTFHGLVHCAVLPTPHCS